MTEPELNTKFLEPVDAVKKATAAFLWAMDSSSHLNSEEVRMKLASMAFEAQFQFEIRLLNIMGAGSGVKQ